MFDEIQRQIVTDDFAFDIHFSSLLCKKRKVSYICKPIYANHVENVQFVVVVVVVVSFFV
jgi:hypothetical protein